ncbi:hypothetical protein ACWEQL_34165 [Kitasatospora sp. NPDC004240]
MTELNAYSPPGNLTDLSEDGRKAWHIFISDSVDEAAKGPDPARVRNDSPRPQFFNLTTVDTAADVTTATVTWTAFPRQVKVMSAGDVQRWTRADASRLVQDEYCEWSITRDDQGKITRVDFTCEGPEYWDVLAQTSPDTVVQLYRKFISPDVRPEHLFSHGRYVRQNIWNNSTKLGAMHLIQPANTLGAEIELAAAASIQRVIGGRPLTSEQELIACGQYGAPERNSDPHIGGAVNEVARAKASLSLADPVGLYFDGLATDGWETPDGSDPHGYWRYERGDADHPVRAVYEVPEGAGFTVGDITVNGRPIRFGAQIADFITIKLTAVAWGFGQNDAAPQTACREDAPEPAAQPEAAFAAAAFSPHGYLGADPRRASITTRTS